MLRTLIVFLVAFCVVSPWTSAWGGEPASRGAPGGPGPDYAPGIVLVSWREEVRAGRADDLLAQGGVARGLGSARRARALPAIGVDVLQVGAGSEQDWLAYLRADPRVAWAELDHRVAVAGAPGARAGDDAGTEAAAVTPNDPSYARQWGLATMRLPEAWQRTTGAPGAVIAIVDTGLDLDHPDLAGKLWSNPGEIAGNGLDDDGNGHSDDLHGWHFFHTYSGDAYLPAEDANLTDEHGHGTHVAGTAAASTNNGVGGAGVSWGARIMVVRVLDADGTGWYSDVVAAVLYAADNGARVINLSLGDAEPSPVLCEAIHYARSRGRLVVAAAGNAGGAVFCPATCSDALAVAASDSADLRAPYSNYGPEIDLAAPGSSVYSTWPWLDGYMTLSGTSMAAAHVSGLAALVWSLWPDLGPDQVAQQMMRTAKDLGPVGVDVYTGHGRVDAAAATAARPEGYRLVLPLALAERAAPAPEPTPATAAPR